MDINPIFQEALKIQSGTLEHKKSVQGFILYHLVENMRNDSESSFQMKPGHMIFQY